MSFEKLERCIECCKDDPYITTVKDTKSFIVNYLKMKKHPSLCISFQTFVLLVT